MKILDYILFCMVAVFSIPSWAQEKIQLDQDSFTKSLDTWFRPEICNKDPGNNIYITFTNKERATFKINRKDYMQSIPTLFEMSQKAGGDIKINLPKTTGCMETPLNVAQLVIKPPKNIDGYSIVFQLNNSNHGSNLVKLRDSQECKEIEKGLVFCSGNQTFQEIYQKVEYYIAKDSLNLMKSGSPLHSRCVFRQDIKICTISDRVNSETNYELLIKGEPTLKKIKNLHRQLEDYLSSIRIN